MIIDFSQKLESVQNEKTKKEIICRCALDSFIASTQEINSILIILKDEKITPSEFVSYVVNQTDRTTPHLLARLAKVQGENLLALSKALNDDLSKQPKLSEEESDTLNKQINDIGIDYFLDNDTIIGQKLKKHIDELLEMDSI